MTNQPPDWATQIAAEKLPCNNRDCRMGNGQSSLCPAYYRPVIATAIRETSTTTDGERLFMGLAHSLIRRILEADANCDPPTDVGLRLEAIIRERDDLREAEQRGYRRGVEAAEEAAEHACTDTVEGRTGGLIVEGIRALKEQQ